MDTFVDRESFSQIREIDNDSFKSVHMILNDFLKVNKRYTIDSYSTTYNNIKDIVESHISTNSELSIDKDRFKVTRILYKHLMRNNPSATVYLVSGVYLNIFDGKADLDSITYTKISESCLPYIKLPSYADKNTKLNYIVFSDVINQLIERPRTLINYDKKEFLKELTVDDEEDFARDCYYFSYLTGLMNLVGTINYKYGDALTYLFIFSNIDTEDHVDKHGINAVSDITDNDMKGIICSHFLFNAFLSKNIGKFKISLESDKALDEKYYRVYNDLIKEHAVPYTEKIIKQMNILSSEEFICINNPLSKVAYLYKNNI